MRSHSTSGWYCGYLIPPTYFIAFPLWIWAEGAAVAVAWFNDEALDARGSWRTDWRGATVATIAAAAVLLLIAVIRDA